MTLEQEKANAAEANGLDMGEEDVEDKAEAVDVPCDLPRHAPPDNAETTPRADSSNSGDSANEIHSAASGDLSLRESIWREQEELAVVTAQKGDDEHKRSEAPHDATHPRLRGIEAELEALSHADSKNEKGLSHRALKVVRSSTATLTQSTKMGMGGFINTPCGNMFFGGIIILNAIFIGIETDAVREVDGSERSEEWAFWFVVESLFLATFVFELLLRFNSLGFRAAFRDYWTIFDITLVSLGILDTCLMQFLLQKGRLLKILRLIRLLRVLRIIRLFRFFKELSLLAQGILAALQAMSWSALLIIVVLYVSAVLMTSTLGRSTTSEGSEIPKWFGSLGSSLFTLFQLMTLEDWPGVVRESMEQERLLFAFFLPFMMFTNFAMLNVITAVVCEKVFTIARAEATMEARRTEKKRNMLLRKIKQLFDEIDIDSSKELELEEFREALKRPHVTQQFLELGIARYEADDLFACLDVDGSHTLSIPEFVEGCLRVHGPAQSKHLLQTQYDVLRGKEQLEADLNEVGWYVRWVIRHLSYRYYRKSKITQAECSGQASPPEVLREPVRERLVSAAQRLSSMEGTVVAPSEGFANGGQAGTCDQQHFGTSKGNGAVEVPGACGMAAAEASEGSFAPDNASLPSVVAVTATPADAETEEAVQVLRDLLREQVALRGLVESLLADVRSLHGQFGEIGVAMIAAPSELR